MASNSFITSSSKASDQETAVFVEPSFNCCCFQVNPDLGMVAPGSITAMSKEQPPPNKKNLNARKVRKKKKILVMNYKQSHFCSVILFLKITNYFYSKMTIYSKIEDIAYIIKKQITMINFLR